MMMLLSENLALLGALVFILGLFIGSFLNVVIHRLPIMMERQWKAECAEIMGTDAPAQEPVFNLAVPRSRCPHCGHQITAIENVPVLSWVFLKGKCSGCKKPISARYPLVELATAALTLLVFVSFGPTWQSVFGIGFTWALIALTMIDFDTQLLPDDITLPLMWAGILANMYGAFVSLESAVIGAVLGYLMLWSVYWLFKLFTGKEGMGYGDFKLLAALGAWMGPTALPLIILLSSVVGVIISVIRGQKGPFAFGPFLAIAGFIAFLWGNQIVAWYLGLL